METRPKRVEIYETDSGECPYENWFDRLKDRRAQAKIKVRISRVEEGNMGDCKPVGAGVVELIVPCGPGYRIYVGQMGASLVVLLCAGDKSTQLADIAQAKEYWADYLQTRSRKEMVASHATN